MPIEVMCFTKTAIANITNERFNVAGNAFNFLVNFRAQFFHLSSRLRIDFPMERPYVRIEMSLS